MPLNFGEYDGEKVFDFEKLVFQQRFNFELSYKSMH